MRIIIRFYSFFKELAGCAETAEILPPGSSINDLLTGIKARFPHLAPMEKSMLVAVGVEYQDRRYVLKDGDEVSLFPPVQGG
jgi:molybdopterin converting factor small subunit